MFSGCPEKFVDLPATIDITKLREKIKVLTVGGGLQLAVLRSGSKTWRSKYQLNGKREKVMNHADPALTIKQARDCHQDLKALVDRGQSPAKARCVVRLRTRRPASRSTFLLTRRY